MTTPLIEITNVRRTYRDGSPALDGVTMTIGRGEAVAIVGPSGSGKSTLLNLIAGLDRPTEGIVTVDGTVISSLNERASALYRRSTIGMIFQFFNLLDDLTVADNVALTARLVGVKRRQATARAGELLESLGIGHLAAAYPGRLSGGERQRVAVARALMNRPMVLLADEPTGALDRAASADVARLLTELHTNGQTMVVVTHDESLASGITTRTIRLIDGRLTGGQLDEAHAGAAR